MILKDPLESDYVGTYIVTTFDMKRFSLFSSFCKQHNSCSSNPGWNDLEN